MSDWLQPTRTILASALLWFGGAVFFDGVHAVLHLLLRSGRPLLRRLAWPHSIHHEWLDRSLSIRWENQGRNVWCHLVPEFATQLAFSAVASLVLPAAMVVGCIALQVAVFAGMLWYRGLDINHRAIAVLDAYRPSFVCYPAYHALHHVYPDAYFSAYGKLVDWIVGSGTCLTGRSFALQGEAMPFADALRDLLRAASSNVVTLAASTRAYPADLDVLVLCDPGDSEADRVERFIEATRTRQIPPEVWAVHETAADGLARHYYGDPRVIYRMIVMRTPRAVVAPGVAHRAAASARSAAKVAMFCIRRGFHFVPTSISPDALRDFLGFRRVTPTHPPGARMVRTRAEMADDRCSQSSAL